MDNAETFIAVCALFTSITSIVLSMISMIVVLKIKGEDEE